LEWKRQWREKGVTYYFVLLSVDFRLMIERGCCVVAEAAVVVLVAVGGSQAG
jgi:hypothetical protein